jgi:hypothetical protein
MSAEDSAEGVEGLAAVAADLSDSIDTLTTSIEHLQADTRVNRRVIRVLSGLVVLKVATIIVLFFALVGLSDTNRRLATTQHDVLCPLYQLFLSATAQPQPGETAAQKAQREAAAPLLAKSYRTLGCQPPLPGR